MSGNAQPVPQGRYAPGDAARRFHLHRRHDAAPGFTKHSALADFASALLEARLGARGIGSRAAVGVASLPGNAPVEIQLIAAV